MKYSDKYVQKALNMTFDRGREIDGHHGRGLMAVHGFDPYPHVHPGKRMGFHSVREPFDTVCGTTQNADRCGCLEAIA